MQPFRFGFQATTTDAEELVRAARAAEAAGFDVFQVGDHVGSQLSPFVALATAAAATSTIRIGTLVLNNDLRHPVAVAQEAAMLDRVSDGRVELGLGAGHSFTEYAAMGLAFDPPAVRKARSGRGGRDPPAAARRKRRSTTPAATTRRVGAQTLRPVQTRLPLLVGVNGRAALASCRPSRGHRCAHHAGPHPRGRPAPRNAVGSRAPRRDDRLCPSGSGRSLVAAGTACPRAGSGRHRHAVERGRRSEPTTRDALVQT